MMNLSIILAKAQKQDVFVDCRRRLPVYKDDWSSGCKYGLRILAPAAYIFFASILPAVAFGEQLAQNTDGTLTVVQVLVATAISGLMQALVGGQPLLINGVAQPIVTIYTFMYAFCKARPDFDVSLFLPWAAWVCVWTAILLVLMAAFNACRLVHRFTRMSGEIFGMLIAVLFLQQAIQGLITEFQQEPRFRQDAAAAAHSAEGVDPQRPVIDLDLNAAQQGQRAEDEPYWILVNGLWSLFLASGFILTAVLVVTARSWHFGTGVPLLVVAWTALSYALQSGGNPRGVPSGVPRRVSSPLTWQVEGSWATVRRMGQVPGPYIAVALVPGVIIAVLFFFDHGVSSKLGQQKELNLQKGPAYAWDQCLLSVFVLMAGFIGLPPPNGVLPQSPLHTRVCCTLRMTAEASRQRKEKQVMEQWPAGPEGPTGITAGLTTGAAGPTAGSEATDSGGQEPEGVKEAGAVTRGLTEQLRDREGALCDRGGALRDRGGATGQAPQAPGSDRNGQRGLATHSLGRLGETQQAGGLMWGEAQQGRECALKGEGVKAGLPGSAPTSQRENRVRESQQQQQQQQQGQQEQQQEQEMRQRSTKMEQLSWASQGRSSDQAQQEPGGYGEGRASPFAATAGEGGAQVPYSPDGGPCLVRHSVQIRIPRHLVSNIPSDIRHLLTSPLRGMAGSGAGHDLVHHPELAARARPHHEAVSGGPQKYEEETGAGGEDAALELRVAEQRLTNLIQSLCLVASLGAVHVLQLIPTAVVWAYFAYMALESMPGSQFWDRMLLMLTDPRRRTLTLTRAHATYLETVPFGVVAGFTAFEFAYLAGVWALVTWAGIGGIAFPAPIIALIPIRSYLLPRLFKPEHLGELDADEYDIVEPLPADQAVQETGQAPWDMRDLIESQYSGTQVLHRISHEALRRRTHNLDPRASLARASAPAKYYTHPGEENV